MTYFSCQKVLNCFAEQSSQDLKTVNWASIPSFLGSSFKDLTKHLMLVINMKSQCALHLQNRNSPTRNSHQMCLKVAGFMSRTWFLLSQLRTVNNVIFNRERLPFSKNFYRNIWYLVGRWFSYRFRLSTRHHLQVKFEMNFFHASAT